MSGLFRGISGDSYRSNGRFPSNRFQPWHWIIRTILAWIGLVVPVFLAWIVIVAVFWDGSTTVLYEKVMARPKWALELELFNSSWITGALFVGLATATIIWFRDITVRSFVEGENAWYRLLSLVGVFFLVYLFYPVVMFNLHSLGGGIFIAILLVILSFVVLAYLFFKNIVAGIVFSPVVLYCVYLSIMTIEIYTMNATKGINVIY